MALFGVARKDNADTVFSPDGTVSGECSPGVPQCDAPSIQSTKEGSSNVFINGIGAVRFGDAMKTHTHGCGCVNHSPTLSTSSSTVLVNGRGIGRNTDSYGGDHPLSSGSTNVYAG
jgi:uncharacterized Zn-binding protein involved in type VI secretion